ncbi:HNH endonuclease [Lyngbya sp. CCY1209]|uniref:HNH endonuclease n=1 Tax=Lyngbya sp. CCY1209 TaxID=2886103 RepID=UPI002D2170C9|nr:HNH endonuclease [Lyngbya sp. CCY1209]MEB3884062.1 HNH endonuclease [Lyngbya sp. CCY1209]
MIKDLSYYSNKFSRLRVDRARGVAPNKPVLLLSVIELIRRGQIRRNRIELSPELIATFLNLWTDLDIQRDPQIGLPFFHLRSEGFWHFRANPGFEFVESKKSKVKVRAVGSLRQAVAYAYLDAELFAMLLDPVQRTQLTSALIQTWFAEQTQRVEHSLEIDAFENLQEQLRATGGKVYSPEEVEGEDEQRGIVRDAAFRRLVINVYGYRCAFCGLQILNGSENIVDGAHIMPFAQFGDDRIDNGLCLCKNHHWAFDSFWFTINDDYTIEVADTLHEDSPDAPPMKQFRGRRLWLPNNERYCPRADALAWHRRAFADKTA